MRLTKLYLNQVFCSTLIKFNREIIKIDNNVVLGFIEKDEFLEGVKNDPLIKQQILLGIYKDINKEYPNFVVVYNTDKDPMRKLFSLPYKITVCFEMAKDLLKPYSKQEVRCFLERVFAHELSHIAEGEIMKTKPDLWETCLKDTGNNPHYAKEYLAEYIADMISETKTYQKIFNSIWSVVNNRIKKLEKNRIR